MLTREQRDRLKVEVDRRRRAQLIGDSRSKRPPAVRRGIAWLEEYLSHGPRDGREVKKAAARDGIKGKPLRLAREALGVLTTNGGRAGSTWRLP